MGSHRHGGSAVLVSISALLASSVFAGERGGLVGWVEDTRGAPVAGAVISVFGKGIGNGGLVTLTDSAGRFALPRLPVGSYTLRALDSGHVPSPARRFTVLPETDATFTVSLTPTGQDAPDEEQRRTDGDGGEALREWRWLLRHKRRSVLEARAAETLPAGALRTADSMPAAPPVPWLADLDGSVELVTVPLGIAFPAEVSMAGQGALRLSGRLAEGVHWTLGGLVTESRGTSWRTAAEFVLEPGGGHTIETGAGYGLAQTGGFGTGADGAIDPRGVGAMFLRSRLRLAEHVTASLGTRYSYFGFLDDANHLDGMLSVEVETAPGTTVRGSAASRTLAPGGDLLTLSTRDSSPLIAYAAIVDHLQAPRTTRYDLAVDRSVGPTTLSARALYEDTTHQIVNVFEPYPSTRSLHMFNVGPLAARGVGVSLARDFGDAVSGSISYTYGLARRRGLIFGDGLLGGQPAGASFRKADFHDVEARVETFFDLTDTRVQAFCRINTLNPSSDGPGGNSAVTNTRFDIQLTQGLPFLQPLTRADWEVLVAFRNLYYEPGEGGLFDEIVVLHPPRRVVGGIAVRF
ncbi:MAG TPA: TonB-dependent receptor [Vicinamibacteria bacterium]|nr:TonB-dependent receptor [Vicinamibacteria bacterium]